LDLPLLIDAEDERLLWGIQIQPHHLMEFLETQGILAELEGLHRGGVSPWALQTRCTKEGLKPRCRANVRRDQCVAAGGGLCKVVVTIRS
jgi:hypothetical protein